MSGKGRETVYCAAMTWSEQKALGILPGADTLSVRNKEVCRGLSVRYTSYERIRSPAPCRHFARAVPFYMFLSFLIYLLTFAR